jgi:hypothetical protein
MQQAKYLVGFLVIMAIVIGGGFILVRNFSGQAQTSTPRTELVSIASTDAVTKMTIYGPITDDQSHYEVKVTIGRTANSIDVIKGYQGQVIQSKTFNNNEPGYAAFLRAIDLLGYTQQKGSESDQDNRGVCPTGSVYTFEVVGSETLQQKTWTSTCGGGTFGGKVDPINQLFRKQIPDYSGITKEARLK